MWRRVVPAGLALAVPIALSGMVTLAPSPLGRLPAPTPSPARTTAPPGAPLAPGETLGPAGIRIRGGRESGLPVAVLALERVLRTPTGRRARDLLEQGQLARPITIELNREGDNFTRYRVPGEELGETIAFDPSAHPLVETEEGRVPAWPETVLAHELGHALFKLDSEADVIREVENPVRVALGLPRRSRF